MGHRRRLGSERGTGSAEGSGRAKEKPFCPQPHPTPGLSISRGQSQAFPIPLPTWTPFLHGSEAGPWPQRSLPIAPTGTDVQHAGGGGLCKAPPVSAGPVKTAHAPLENLQTAGGEVCRPCTPPGDRAGGSIQRKTWPLQPHGVHPWLGQEKLPWGQEPDRLGRRSAHRCESRRLACAESQPESRAGIWSWVGTRVRLKPRAGAEPRCPQSQGTSRSWKVSTTHPDSWTPGAWK